MRSIHTSDFHLHPDAPERMDALRQVVSLANSESADALLIPGDLFDSPEVAGALRVQTRAILDSFTGTTVITPGNHDLGAFPPKTDYGDRTILLTTTPYQKYSLRSSDGPEGIAEANYGRVRHVSRRKTERYDQHVQRAHHRNDLRRAEACATVGARNHAANAARNVNE